jgi:hypothetical protein
MDKDKNLKFMKLSYFLIMFILFIMIIRNYTYIFRTRYLQLLQL